MFELGMSNRLFKQVHLLYFTFRYCRQHPRYRAINALIASIMGSTWAQSGADRTQVGPMLAPWTLPSWWVRVFHGVRKKNPCTISALPYTANCIYLIIIFLRNPTQKVMEATSDINNRFLGGTRSINPVRHVFYARRLYIINQPRFLW